ncbi:hypothetical protein A8924_0605 [Saccharopolyspora erythraea NRRL 2338]|uniref:Conserved alanine rich lipoprotein LppW n=2 Tax=Saccharopolyspora erythraea TaxID=1836 RepID=A4F694_SACEN|nr:hypothetical protein [Saccharopolyspora erythraea]EQD88052.1 hypothetical protein N599_01095 [Saccharopolyspora erythraea D]PFG93370.1 hypothetical protein A8924_0605 [Saccharopolyspora erythraea NRRL 2338]QRK90205.1 hypothetical protein JQX30_01085 [Saccharopolyspora erythraea]CAL99568.1 putative conserved alanine rich lipoprotein LppW [Saccharopolyspora erythraea NRRL 2338]
MDDISAGYLVVDAASGRVLSERDPRRRFRSASIVKILIALDHLLELGPGGDIPDDDRALLGPMLRASNDDAASTLWERAGQRAVIDRMAPALGLRDTEPPADEGMWGYTAISAADVVRIYLHLLHDAPDDVGAFVLGHLRNHTQWADDGFDQSFGLPSALPDAGAVKQGWSGFGSRARTDAGSGDGIDLKRPAMHTTGTTADDGTVIAVLTLHPDDTDWDTAAKRVTELTRAIVRT